MLEQLLEILWQTAVIDVARFEVWIWTTAGGFVVEAAAALTFGIALAYALFGGRHPTGDRRIR